MKKATTLFLVSGMFIALTAFTLSPPGSPEYVGSKSCKGCHKSAKGGKAYPKWESTSHANAFKTLQTPEADKIAADKGFTTKAAETDNCLSCHVTGMNVEGAAFHKKFKKEEGVGCESCHGAASGYKMKHSKAAQKEAAKAAGFSLPNISDGSAEALCITCHNENSPTYKPFDLKEKWSKIEHGLPE